MGGGRQPVLTVLLGRSYFNPKSGSWNGKSICWSSEKYDNLPKGEFAWTEEKSGTALHKDSKEKEIYWCLLEEYDLE